MTSATRRSAWAAGDAANAARKPNTSPRRHSIDTSSATQLRAAVFFRIRGLEQVPVSLSVVASKAAHEEKTTHRRSHYRRTRGGNRLLLLLLLRRGGRLLPLRPRRALASLLHVTRLS